MQLFWPLLTTYDKSTRTSVNFDNSAVPGNQFAIYFPHKKHIKKCLDITFIYSALSYEIYAACFIFQTIFAFLFKNQNLQGKKNNP